MLFKSYELLKFISVKNHYWEEFGFVLFVVLMLIQKFSIQNSALQFKVCNINVKASC